jgi:hypothetical protein
MRGRYPGWCAPSIRATDKAAELTDSARVLKWTTLSPFGYKGLGVFPCLGVTVKAEENCEGIQNQETE